MGRRLFLGWLLAVGVGCTSVPSELKNSTEHEKLSAGCQTPLGFIPEGRTATGYLHQIENNGQRCQQGSLSCEDGVWAGAYIYPSCVTAP